MKKMFVCRFDYKQVRLISAKEDPGGDKFLPSVGSLLILVGRDIPIFRNKSKINPLTGKAFFVPFSEF